MTKAIGKTGQSLVEFMLIIPIFLFALIVFVDLGRALFINSSLSNAVRAGTRYAVVHPVKTLGEQAVVEQVIKDAATGLDETSINITWNILPTAPDYLVEIHASYSFLPVTPGLELILGTGNPINLQAQSRMQVAPLYQD